MSAIHIDGKKIAAETYASLKAKIADLDKVPRLDVILIGEDPASGVYVRMKEKRSRELGLHSAVHRLPESTTEDELLALVQKLNTNDEVHGILVQVPLPGHIDESRVLESVSPKKDVDCFHPFNVGRLVSGNPVFAPCTPAGVMRLLDAYDIALEGKHVVMIGRSNIVGKPLSILMLERHATVTICHSRTRNLPLIASKADVLVAAVGRPNFVGSDMVGEGAVLLDVGINRVDDPSREKGYRLVGDIDYEACREKASYITPVPGGVGAMTIAMLMENCLKAFEIRNE